jgi:hypothetical protein
LPTLLIRAKFWLWLHGMRRTARKVIEGKATIQRESIAATLLANQALNLWGIGSALIGLQVPDLAHFTCTPATHHVCIPQSWSLSQPLCSMCAFAACCARPTAQGACVHG